jgi:hypothetical protein
MGEVLEVMVAAAAVALAMASIAAVLLARQTRRAVRLVPEVATPVPFSWCWSWLRPARLHRRLRQACRTVRAAAEPFGLERRRWRRDRRVSPFRALADELIGQAVALDRRLLVASRFPVAWRGPALNGLAVEVAEVEAAAVRLARLSTAWQAQLEAAAEPQTIPHLGLGTRLDAVEAAMGELKRIDQPWPARPAG